MKPSRAWLLIMVGMLGCSLLVGCSEGNVVPPNAEPAPPHKIVFNATDADGNYTLYLSNGDGTELKTLFSTDNFMGDLWVSPQGDRVVFCADTSDVPGSDYELFLAKIDGSRVVRITDNEAAGCINGVIEEPQWFPDGQEILFGRSQLHGMQFYRVLADGSRVIRITSNDNTSHRFPRLSPDGQKVAFEKRGSSNTVWVMDIDGGKELLLSAPTLSGAYGDWYPEWTFDSRQIVYFNAEGLWIIDADGRNRRHLTVGAGHQCSPVAGKVAFGGVFTINLDGSELRQLADFGSGYPLVWSRDGVWIAFRGDANRDGKAGICCINFDGAGLREMTSSDFDIAPQPARAFDWVTQPR